MRAQPVYARRLAASKARRNETAEQKLLRRSNENAADRVRYRRKVALIRLRKAALT